MYVSKGCCDVMSECEYIRVLQRMVEIRYNIFKKNGVWVSRFDDASFEVDFHSFREARLFYVILSSTIRFLPTTHCSSLQQFLFVLEWFSFPVV